MRTDDDRIRQVIQRCDRIASGEPSTYPERVADALTALADVIEQHQSDDNERLRAWRDAMGYIGNRVRDDVRQMTGEDLEGDE